MGNSCTSVFPNTLAWEQQEFEIRQRNKRRKKGGPQRGVSMVSMERSKIGTKKRSLVGLSLPN